MKIVLLYPPFADLTQVSPSLPYLTAILKQNAHNVIQKDINIEAHDNLLTKKTLNKNFEKASARLCGLKKREYSQLKEKNLKMTPQDDIYVIKNIEKAKEYLRNTKYFYNYKKYLWARKIIEQGLRLISVAYYPTYLSLVGYRQEVSVRSFTSIIKAINNKKENPYLDFFEENTLPFILNQNPKLIGISIGYISQLIPALTLANLIKKRRKDIHITVGGNCISSIVDKLRKRMGYEKIFTLIDSMIIYDGEHALLELVKQLEKENNLTAVPNLIYCDSKGIHFNDKVFIEDLNRLPTPCFDGIPFHLYFSPKPVLTLSITRGCYWHKCAFCTFGHSEVTRSRYRERNANLIIQDIRYLSKRHNTKYFFFTVDVASPSLIKQLSSMLLKTELDIRWQYNARLEKNLKEDFFLLLYKAGCRNISFGLESASQRILDLMEKGTRIENIMNILKSCHRAKIAVNMGIFIGFPTEKRKEAIETVNFVLKNNNLISSVSSGPFTLYEKSKVFRYPERYGIAKTKNSYNFTAGVKLYGILRSKIDILYPNFTFPFNGYDALTLLYLSYFGLERFRKIKDMVVSYNIKILRYRGKN